MKKLILASASPRRKEILDIFTSDYEVKISHVSEKMDKDIDIYTNLMTIAKRKGESVLNSYPDSIVLSADTIVTYQDNILEKPTDEKDAREYLNILSDSTHSVITAFCIQTDKHISVVDYEETYIQFKKLDDQIIENYIKTGEWKDKAGGYGIQGYGSVLVDNINGDYFNVVGLPISRIYKYLLDYFDFDLMEV